MLVMVMMAPFRNYRPPPAGNIPDQPKAGHASRSFKHGSFSIRPELLAGRYARKRIPEAHPQVSAYSQVEGSWPYKTTSDHTPNLI